LTIASIFARQRLALQFPVPTPIERLKAAKDKLPSLMAFMIVILLTLRQMQTFLKFSINCFCVFKFSNPRIGIGL